MNPITPFAAARVANVVLKAAGQERTVTPQMLYSYARNKRITTVKVDGTDKIFFDGNAFKKWLDAYVQNKSGTGKVDYDELAKQYM
jgi:hypothetical protein